MSPSFLDSQPGAGWESKKLGDINLVVANVKPPPLRGTKNVHNNQFWGTSAHSFQTGVRDLVFGIWGSRDLRPLGSRLPGWPQAKLMSTPRPPSRFFFDATSWPEKASMFATRCLAASQHYINPTTAMQHQHEQQTKRHKTPQHKQNKTRPTTQTKQNKTKHK